MRSIRFRLAAALALVSPALITSAMAQLDRGGHGLTAIPHNAAPGLPAFHSTNPIPHLATPTPHFAAPSAHLGNPIPVNPMPHGLGLPHLAGPTHLGRPYSLSPQVAPSSIPHFHIAHPNLGHPNAVIGRHSLPGATARHAGLPAPGVVGQVPTHHGRPTGHGTPQAQIYAAGHHPVLHNPAFIPPGTRNRTAQALAQTTFHGQLDEMRDHRRSNDHDHDHDRWRGRVIGWLGPVFWPYADDDLIDYALWSYNEDTFWPYAYDDVYDDLFDEYAAGYSADANASTSVGSTGGVSSGAMAEVCGGQASELTDLPIEHISKQVQPDAAQNTLLDQLKGATAEAIGVLKSACPTNLPSTPTGRLAAMRQRVAAMLQAVRLVRPALDAFYNSLSDEQKARFNALEPQGATTAQPSDLAQVCGGSGTPAASLPLNQIEQALQPNDAQRAALQALNDATAKVATLLHAKCPQDQALTPTSRTAAMEQRLEVMLQAIDTLQPALTKFYDSLSSAQKARFNRLHPSASTT